MRLWRRLRYLLPSVRRAEEREMYEELESLAAMAGQGELGNLTLAAEQRRDVGADVARAVGTRRATRCAHCATIQLYCDRRVHAQTASARTRPSSAWSIACCSTRCYPKSRNCGPPADGSGSRGASRVSPTAAPSPSIFHLRREQHTTNRWASVTVSPTSDWPSGAGSTVSVTRCFRRSAFHLQPAGLCRPTRCRAVRPWLFFWAFDNRDAQLRVLAAALRRRRPSSAQHYRRFASREIVGVAPRGSGSSAQSQT